VCRAGNLNSTRLRRLHAPWGRSLSGRRPEVAGRGGRGVGASAGAKEGGLASVSSGNVRRRSNRQTIRQDRTFTPPMRLVAVRSDDVRLHERVQAEFADDPDVEVIKDRRHADRRTNALGYEPERRRGDRRIGEGPVGRALKSVGWAEIVRLDPPREPPSAHSSAQ
jgi:hypothetical protein